MPRVSVIIPTFNCAGFIERTLTSVFSQTFKDYEVIVLDDGSTDETSERISRFSRSIHYHHQSNCGLSNARNKAVSLSNGEFIAYLDADDMWCPQKLQRQIEYMDAHPECGLVHSDVIYIDEEDQLITPEWSLVNRSVLAQGNCLAELLKGCLFQVPTVLERRECFDSISGFDERFKRVEDYLHWIKLQLKGYSFGYINEYLAMYRIRSGSLSKNHAAMIESTMKMFDVLIRENSLLDYLNQTEKKNVLQRISSLKRSLPYHYRLQGRNGIAIKQSLSLIFESPGHLYPLVELAKSLVPPPMADKIRKIRNRNLQSSGKQDSRFCRNLQGIE